MESPNPFSLWPISLKDSFLFPRICSLLTCMSCCVLTSDSSVPAPVSSPTEAWSRLLAGAVTESPVQAGSAGYQSILRAEPHNSIPPDDKYTRVQGPGNSWKMFQRKLFSLSNHSLLSIIIIIWFSAVACCIIALLINSDILHWHHYPVNYWAAQ